uniref:RING-type domain-containing protein n=1 Tax=Oreochromis aureus TaxID=47969 RepID=A0A668SJ20_OREAU
TARQKRKLSLYDADMVASALVSEDSLLCPVCLSVFTKPVTIPCGHNFCLDCLTEYWSYLVVENTHVT